MVDVDITDIIDLGAERTELENSAGGDLVSRYFDPAYGGGYSRPSYRPYPTGTYGLSSYYFPIAGSFHGFRSGLRYGSSMRWYHDYYKQTGKHHAGRYYTGFKYWR